jgi:hypothetical protein
MNLIVGYMPPRLKYKNVRQYYIDNNCKLLSKEYYNKKTNLEFIARCGHKDISTFACFQLRDTKNCIQCVPSYFHSNPEYIHPNSFKKLLRIMNNKFKRTLKYRDDYLLENYEQLLTCWDCKETKTRRVFPYRKQYKYNKEKRCKRCNNENRSERRNNHTIEQMINDMVVSSKHAARKRKERGRLNCGIHTITTDDVLKIKDLQNNKCVYTGQELIWEYNHNYKASIDRIDSNRGYIPDNIQLVSQIANQAKSNMDEEEFLHLIEQIFFNVFLR